MGTCIENVASYQSATSSQQFVRNIPIRPFDALTMQRLSYRQAPINYDAEAIDIPLQGASSKLKPFQIMERISVPVDLYDAHSRKKNKVKPVEFNYHNFDGSSYQYIPHQSIANIPNAQQTYSTQNHTADRMPLHRNRARHGAKKTKRNNAMHRQHRVPVQYDDQGYYRAYVEQAERQAAVDARRKQQAKHPNKLFEATKLPPGVEYFEPNRPQKVFMPVSYTPMYGERFKDDHQFQDVETANSHIFSQRFELIRNDELVTTTLAPVTATPSAPLPAPTQLAAAPPASHSIVPVRFLHAKGSEKMVSDSKDDVPYAERVKSIPDPKAIPEMFRFTINDAIIRPPGKNGVYVGPMSPPPVLHPLKQHHRHHHNHDHNLDPTNDLHATKRGPARVRGQQIRGHINGNFHSQQNHQQQSSIQGKPYQQQIHHATQLTYPPSGRDGYRRLEHHQYQPTVPEIADSLPHQSHQPPNIEPIVMSTQMTVTTGKSSDPTNVPNEMHAMDSKRMEKRLKRRQRPHDDRRSSDASSMKDTTMITTATPMHLEFSHSYTKRRTQGYNSGEDTMTTPIPVKLKNARSQLDESVHEAVDGEPRHRHHQQQSYEQQQQQPPRHVKKQRVSTTTAQDVNELNRDEDAKYFQ